MKIDNNMGTDNNLFQALLKKEGISNLYPFKIEKNKSLYGYFKGNHFYICNNEFKEINLNEYLEQDNIVIGLNNGTYVNSVDNIQKGWILGKDGAILIEFDHSITKLEGTNNFGNYIHVG